MSITREQLDEIEKRWDGYLEKNEVERRFLFEQWWDKRDFWDMTKACAGGCYAERTLTEREAAIANRYNIKWYCQGCADLISDNALLDPILTALTRQPHLRAKLREILEME